MENFWKETVFVWRFISDLHNMEFGPDNTVLKAVIDEAAPDLVIIGGDQIVAKPGENLDRV